MASNSIPEALFLDIGDVLCSWKFPPNLPIPTGLFAKWRETRIWQEYDCGIIEQDECFSRLAALGGVSQHAVGSSVRQIIDTVSQNDEVVSLIKELRQREPHLRVYALSNISRADWEVIRVKSFDWGIFDEIFTSHEAGMRKPELRFYRHTLRLTHTSANEAILIDDKQENIIAARSVGFREAVLFDSTTDLRRLLLNLFGDAVQRARTWLSTQPEGLYSESDAGVIIPDNFSQLLIHEALGDLDLVRLKQFERTWNYFIESPWGTTETYPDDADTTSYALKLFPGKSSVVHSVLNELVSTTTADGIIKVYFADDRDRVDPVVCVNILRLFYHHGRGTQPETQPTKDWARDVLLYRAYLKGTRYYHAPEAFLYFFARLVCENPSSDLSTIKPLVEERLLERVNCPADAMGLAMRVIACQLLGLSNESDLHRLLQKQQIDGSFEIVGYASTERRSSKLGAEASRRLWQCAPSKTSVRGY